MRFEQKYCHRQEEQQELPQPEQQPQQQEELHRLFHHDLHLRPQPYPLRLNPHRPPRQPEREDLQQNGRSRSRQP
jgi:hypothetical protein